MTPIYFIYHGNCYDGFGAAYSAWKYFIKHSSGMPIFIPAVHGEPFPLTDLQLKGAEVYIADFTFPRAELLRIFPKVKKLQVLDHHKTAEANLQGLDFAFFDMNRSGAMITWNFFHGEAPAPKLIEYIQDRDLWHFKLPSSKAIHSVIQSYSVGIPAEGKNEPDSIALHQKTHPAILQNFARFDELDEALANSEKFDQMVQQGEAILRFQSQGIEVAIRRSVRWIHLSGHKVPVVNTSLLESEICHKLLDLYPEAPFVASYYRGHSHRNYSLRSRGDFDVSAIARKFGGGGHYSAAGFRKELK